jgi:tetratricopeptide (TPR) repeat protein
VLPVEVLAPGDAAGLLLTRAEATGPTAEAAATTLAATLGALPLALEQAGAYVTATGTMTLAAYAELFASRALELLHRGQPLGYQHTVATTWSLALQQLRDTEPAAVDLLTLASFLSPDDLPQPLLATHHDQLPEPLAAAAGDPLALGDAVAALRRYSLVRVVADGLFVHRLLQTVIRTALNADAERVWGAAAVRLARAGFPNDTNEVATWPDCERLLRHALTAAEHGQRLDLELEACSSMLNDAGVYLRSRGQFQLARELHEQALQSSRRGLGAHHLATLSSMGDLAVAYRALGDFRGARDLLEQALAASRQVQGDDHPRMLFLMTNLARTYRSLGDLQRARDLLEQALSGRRRVLGDDHPSTLRSMNFLAGVRRSLSDLQGARDLLEQALAAGRQVQGDDHHDTLHSMNNLAKTLRALGDLHGAHQLHEQGPYRVPARAGRRPPRHPGIDEQPRRRPSGPRRPLQCQRAV